MPTEPESTSKSPTELWDSWRLQLSELGGANPLRNFELNDSAQIDLTKSHPGGLAQFVSSGNVKLSNLVRDPLALTKANAAAYRIHEKARSLREAFGIESTYLVGAVASLTGSGYDLSLPVLLWPIALDALADDYQVQRIAEPLVNPELVSSFEDCFNVKIDQRKLLAKLNDGSDLVPMSVLEYLSDLGSNGNQLELKRVLAIGNFAPDVHANRHQANVAMGSAAEALASANQNTGDLSADSVLNVFDLDSNQQNLIKRALAEENFAVETLPGCGYTQTVAAILANFAYQQKRVLLVANRSQTISEVTDRLTQVGLAGLVARNDHGWLDVISAISRNEKAQPSDLAAIEKQHQLASDSISNYFEKLKAVDSTFGVSIMDCLGKLAELAAMPHAPLTTAKLENLRPRAEYSAELELLEKAANLGLFEFGPNQSAWFGANFSTEAELEQSLAVANRLRDQTFPQLSEKLSKFIDQAEFAPAKSVEQWGEYLRLFVGLRETLDRLKPEVFDRPLDDLLIATAARKVKGEMTGKTRRRLKKLAKEFIRPGITVSDINASLSAAKLQRETWAKYTTSLKPPMVPVGINDALVTYQALVNDLLQVESHLAKHENLESLDLSVLAARLDSLCDDVQPLQNYSEKAQLQMKLAASGLQSLVADFGRLQIKAEHLVVEFDQAWWQSALERVLLPVAEVVALPVEKLSEAEASFCALDSARVAHSQLQLAKQLSINWSEVIRNYPAQVELFRSLLKSGRTTLQELIAVAPELLFAVSPVLAYPALRVATELPDDLLFDVVIILDAAGSATAENLAALNRAKQVIAFGDPVISSAIGFETEPVEPIESRQSSTFDEVKQAFGSELLRLNYRTSGQILGSFVNREFYQNRIVFQASLDDYLGKSHVQLNLISEGNQAPEAKSSNESLDAEVIKTVELVFNHAVWFPEESLLVATASDLHADRVRASVKNGLKNRPDLQAWFDSHGFERFEVSTISKLRHRIADRVIFSIGFGKSKHGAVLSNFGDLSRPDGKRALANLLVSARRELHVVSCFTAEELEKADLQNGAAYLSHLLKAASQVQIEESDFDSDPMLTDLALRLRKLGATVKFGFGQDLEMIVSYSNRAMVICPDWRLTGESVSEKLRLRPNLIKALGWEYQRVFAFDLFSDPVTLAESIAKELGLKVKNAGQKSFEQDWTEESNETTGTFESNDSRLKSERPPHWG
ncbi:MAG: hypothetical protein ACKOWE_05680 [Micrococcales bacterium]